MATTITCGVCAVVIGWLAFTLEQQSLVPRFLYPLLFPLLIGTAAGASTVALSRTFADLRPWSIIMIACLSGSLAFGSQVWLSYRDYTTEFDRFVAKNPQAAVFQSMSEESGPVSIARFVQEQIKRSGGWWLADAILTIAMSAIVAVFFADRISKSRPANDHLLSDSNP